MHQVAGERARKRAQAIIWWARDLIWCAQLGCLAPQIVHSVCTGSHLVGTGTHLMCTGAHLVCTDAYLVSIVSHLVCTGYHLVGTGSHLVCTVRVPYPLIWIQFAQDLICCAQELI